MLWIHQPPETVHILNVPPDSTRNPATRTNTSNIKPSPDLQRSVVKLMKRLLVYLAARHIIILQELHKLACMSSSSYVTFYIQVTVSCGQIFFIMSPLSLWICKRLGWWTTSSPNFHQVIVHLLEHQELLHGRSPKPTTLGPNR